MKTTQKLVIIGTGHVGEHVLAYAASSQLYGDIAVIDPRGDIAYGEALDQAHATGLISRVNANIHVGTYEEDVANADIIIVAATHYYPPEPTPKDRQLLMRNNAVVVRDVMSNISRVTQDAIIIFITNPADTVCFMAVDEFNYPKHRVMSTGCMLDSSRLRHYFGTLYGVDPKSVTGYMMGEHGYTAFPVLSRLAIAGIPYAELDEYFPDVTRPTPQQVKDRIVQAAYDVFDAKVGVTNAAVAQAAVELSRAILLDEQTIQPISTYMDDAPYGIERPVAFSVPTVVGRTGWSKRLYVGLDEWEENELHQSVKSIHANIDLARELK